MDTSIERRYRGEGDSKNIRDLLSGASPRNPTYILAVVLSDFVPQSLTEIGVKRGDEIYVMYELSDWAYVACLTDTTRRGYIPLDYCLQVENFFTRKLADRDKREKKSFTNSGHQKSTNRVLFADNLTPQVERPLKTNAQFIPNNKPTHGTTLNAGRITRNHHGNGHTHISPHQAMLRAQKYQYGAKINHSSPTPTNGAEIYVPAIGSRNGNVQQQNYKFNNLPGATLIQGTQGNNIDTSEPIVAGRKTSHHPMTTQQKPVKTTNATGNSQYRQPNTNYNSPPQTPITAKLSARSVDNKYSRPKVPMMRENHCAELLEHSRMLSLSLETLHEMSELDESMNHLSAKSGDVGIQRLISKFQSKIQQENGKPLGRTVSSTSEDSNDSVFIDSEETTSDNMSEVNSKPVRNGIAVSDLSQLPYAAVTPLQTFSFEEEQKQINISGFDGELSVRRAEPVLADFTDIKQLLLLPPDNLTELEATESDDDVIAPPLSFSTSCSDTTETPEVPVYQSVENTSTRVVSPPNLSQTVNNNCTQALPSQTHCCCCVHSQKNASTGTSTQRTTQSTDTTMDGVIEMETDTRRSSQSLHPSQSESRQLVSNSSKIMKKNLSCDNVTQTSNSLEDLTTASHSEKIKTKTSLRRSQSDVKDLNPFSRKNRLRQSSMQSDNPQPPYKPSLTYNMPLLEKVIDKEYLIQPISPAKVSLTKLTNPAPLFGSGEQLPSDNRKFHQTVVQLSMENTNPISNDTSHTRVCTEFDVRAAESNKTSDILTIRTAKSLSDSKSEENLLQTFRKDKQHNAPVRHLSASAIPATPPHKLNKANGPSTVKKKLTLSNGEKAALANYAVTQDSENFEKKNKAVAHVITTLKRAAAGSTLQCKAASNGGVGKPLVSNGDIGNPLVSSTPRGECAGVVEVKISMVKQHTANNNVTEHEEFLI